MVSMLVKGGTVVTPWGRQQADVYVEGEIIKAIGDNLEGLAKDGTRVVDASGCYILPGIIDPHVQVESVYKTTQMTDDFNTGTRAAACSGITTIIDFAVQKQGESALEGLRNRKAQADPKVCVDYSLHVGITDPNDKTLNEIHQIMAEGITSFKCYMTYRNRGRMVDETGLMRAMSEIVKHNGIVEVHAENNTLVEYMTDKLVNEGKTTNKDFPLSRTDICEQIGAATALLLSKYTGCDLYIHHVSSSRVHELVRIAQSEGIKVYGETCPQYLVLDDRVYMGEDGSRFIMNPPIRDEGSKEVLWKGLKQGSLHTVGTDHCSYTCAQKDEHKDAFQMVPAGVPGLETLLPIVYTYGVEEGKVSLERLTEVLSFNAAKIFGLYPKKGLVAVGSDADLVIYDPEGGYKIKAKDLHMLTDFNPYEGWDIKGSVKMTVLRGKPIYENGKFTGHAGEGKFIPGKRGV